MEQLPKLFVDELPQSQKRSKIAIGLIVLILMAMPVGVFLTLRTQNPNSQAALNDIRTPETSISLVSRTPAVNNQSIFPVDVVLHSDQQSSNLFATRISFEKDTLEVVSIASTSADLTDTTRIYPATEWIDASFNNEQGFLNLVAGVPQQGLKTDPASQSQQLLATIFFRAKRGGQPTDLLFQEGSMVLSTEGGQNILSQAQSLVLEINDTVGDFTDNNFKSQAEQFINTASSSATFKIETPNGGEVFSYQTPVNIRWRSNDASDQNPRRPQTGLTQTVSLAIWMNNSFLGFIGTDIPDTGSYVWKASDTLPTEFIKPENTYKIEVEKREPISNRQEKIMSAGPFWITLTPATTAQLLTPANLSSDRTDVNADNVRDYKDVSFMLANYFAPVTEKNVKTDFNNDRIINAIDLWYLKQTIIPLMN